MLPEKIFNIDSNIQITPPIKDHTIKKLGKLGNVFNGITHVYVFLKIDNAKQIAEAKIHLAGGRGELFAKSSSQDMYTSINQLYDKLNSQIKTYKDKLSDK